MPTKDIEKRRQQWREWYERNKSNPKHKKRVRDFDRKRRRELAEWLEEYKSGLKCKECGFSHPAALDFHHRNPEEKSFNISVMPRKSISKEKILAEIAKCDVYCCRCHRILHYEAKKRGRSSIG